MIEAYLLYALGIIFVTFLWAVLFSQKHEGPVSRSLRRSILGVLIWLVLEFLLMMPISFGIELPFMRFLSVWGIVVMILFMRFVYHWIDRRLDWIFWLVITTTVASALLCLTTDSVITGTHRHEYGVIDTRGALYVPATMPTLFGGLWSIWLVFRAWGKATHDARKSLTLILVGSLTSLLISLTTNLILPLFPAVDNLPRMAPFALMPLCGLVLTAVRRHSFLALDVEFVISEILHNVTNGIVLVSRDRIVERINNSALEMLGVNNNQTLRMRLVDLPGGYFFLQQTTREMEFDLMVGGEMRYIRVTQSKDGLSGGRLLILRNITEQRRAEAIKGFAREKFHREINRRKAERSRIEKLEKVGTTAGVIAHDFNNFIAVILGFARAAHDDLEEDNPIKEDFREIMAAGFKARDIVQKVLAFSRRGTRKSTRFDLAEETQEALKLAGVTLPTNIYLESFCQAEHLPVLGDRARIRQALMNILTNAYQSMLPEGGYINVYASVLDVEEDFALMYPPLEPGPHALVRIKDKGKGMDDATLLRAFEPFFTTRASAESVGLGLSTAMKIAQAGAGTIIGESDLGIGSSFSMLYPLAPHEENTNLQDRSAATEILFLSLGEAYDSSVIYQLKSSEYSFRIFADADRAARHIADNTSQVGLVIAPFNAKTWDQSSFVHSALGTNKSLSIILIVNKASVAEQALARETGVQAILPVSKVEVGLLKRIDALLK